MSDYKVIIPSASAENLERCLDSLIRTHPHLGFQTHSILSLSEDVVIVADGLRKNEQGFLECSTKWIEVKSWLDGIRPFSTAQNLNLALKAFGYPDVFILCDDVEILRGSIGDLSDEDVGCTEGVGVLSAMVEEGSCRDIQRYDGKDHLRRSGGLNLHTMPATIAAYIPSGAWKKIGHFDEAFSGYGFEDTDFCFRAQKAGLFVGASDACIVAHTGTSVFRSRPDYEPLYQKSREIFMKKWGV